MLFHRLRLNFICRTLLLLVLLLAGSFARGQNVILHMRNGDRITGVIVFEGTDQLVISNAWTRKLIVPLAQVEKREIPIMPATNLLATATNTPTPATNALTTVIATNIPNAKQLLVSTKTGTLPANTNSFWRRWKGEVSIGMDMERGATDHQLFYNRAKLTYAQPYQRDPKMFFRNIFTYDAEYGKTDGVLSDNRMDGSSKTDFDLTRNFYVYNLGEARYDEVQKIDLHYEEGPGMGYHWFTRTNFTLNLELGANYQVEYRSDGTDTKSAYYRLAEDLMWKLNKQMIFTQKFEYFPRVGYATQYRMRFESTLSYSLIYNLSLNVSLIDFYDTQPAAGIPNNDLQVHTSLGVKF
jgi:hypothetical protein